MLRLVLLVALAFGALAPVRAQVERVTEFPAGVPSGLTAYDGALVLLAADVTHGYELWRYDGSSASLIADIRPGSASGAVACDPPTCGIYGTLSYMPVVAEGVLYFAGDDGIHGAELWRYDGSSTTMIADYNPGQGGASPRWLAEYGGFVYFQASGDAIGFARSDGTTVTPVAGAMVPNHFETYDGALYYTGGLFPELWRFDGTTHVRVADIWPGDTSGPGYSTSSYPQDLTVYDGALYFTADDGTHGRRLWRYDGTAATMVPGSPGFSGLHNGAFLTVYDGALYFTGGTDTAPAVLWRYDGTEITQVPGVPNGMMPQWLAVFDGALYFQGYYTGGEELWRYDGTTVSLIADIRPGAGAGSSPHSLTVVGDTLYFAANEGIGHQLFRYVSPPKPYAVTAPAAGAAALAGTRTVVRWSGAGVPDRNRTVSLSLRHGTDAPVLLGEVRNTGKAKITLPAGLSTASDYRIVVADADSVLGVSAPFVVYTTGEQFTFSEPDPAESWRRGSTHTVLWTTPGTAPASTVTVELVRGGTVVATYPGEPDDGSLDVALAANLQINTNYSVRITNDADAAFFGTSLRFAVTRFEVTDPAEGATWAAGSSQTVNWTTGGASGGTVRISLRRRSVGGGQSLAINVPYGNLTRTVTIPAGAVAADDYFMQLTYVNGTQTYTVNSNTFAVSGAATAPAPEARHFAAPEPVAYASETVLVVRGLADGTEVGAFAGDVLLASGRVEGGEAHLAVSDEIVVDGEEWAVAPDAALSLRAFAGGSETALDARAAVLGSDGTSVEAVRLSAGDVLVIDAGMSSVTAGAPSAFAVSGVSPNPASGAATVRFSLPAAEAVSVVVYDVLGRAVATVYDGPAQAGSNAVAVPSGLPAGVYVVRVSAEGAAASARFTVIR